MVSPIGTGLLGADGAGATRGDAPPAAEPGAWPAWRSQHRGGGLPVVGDRSGGAMWVRGERREDVVPG